MVCTVDIVGFGMYWFRYTRPYYRYFLLAIVLIFNIVLYLQPSDEIHNEDDSPPSSPKIYDGYVKIYAEEGVSGQNGMPNCEPAMSIVTVICGKSQRRRVKQLEALLKSMLFFTSCPLRIIILTDDVKTISAKFGTMTAAPLFRRTNATLQIRPVVYPEYLKENRTMWQSWGPCMTLRLFFPSVFPDLDAVIYMDTDVFAVAPVEKFWRIFEAMSATHFIAVAAESHLGAHWYGRIAKTPYAGATGLNDGVMPMNLTRMRAFGWEEKILAAYDKYKDDFMLIDQDLVNIVLHEHPEGLMNLPHEWNFRNWLCPHEKHTPFEEVLSPNVTGKMLHGDSSNYRDRSKLHFYPFFKAIQKLDVGQRSKDFKKQIVEPVRELMQLPFRSKRHSCAALDEDLLRSIEELDSKTDIRSFPRTV